jgi:hypothetical protein
LIASFPRTTTENINVEEYPQLIIGKICDVSRLIHTPYHHIACAMYYFSIDELICDESSNNESWTCIVEEQKSNQFFITNNIHSTVCVPGNRLPLKLITATNHQDMQHCTCDLMTQRFEDLFKAYSLSPSKHKKYRFYEVQYDVGDVIGIFGVIQNGFAANGTGVNLVVPVRALI